MKRDSVLVPENLIYPLNARHTFRKISILHFLYIFRSKQTI